MGVDIGGTFTDFIIADETGALHVYKTPSTPKAPERAIVTGLEELAAEGGQTVQEYLAGVDLFIHGTTIATNTVIQRNGPRTAAIHTKGFRDILFLRDGFKPDRYDLHMPPPDDFVPRYLRAGIDERVLYTGDVERPLDEDMVRETLRGFREEGVEAIAVSLLWSMVNPAHEERVEALIREELPDVYVATSAQILPAIREYARSCATVLSAYVGPVLGRYLTKVAGYLRDNGYRYDLLIMQITGGSASGAEIEKRPVLAIGSGPAAGPPAGLVVGETQGERNLMVIDMGGTSFEVSTITDGAFTMSRDMEIEGVPLGVAAVDMQSVGAGGGSIAWIDDGGMLRVGPRSAGADPGPACYGQGGTEPTVTDANVILGYLNPGFFLGGRMPLDRALAEQAMERVATPLGLDVTEAAAAVYRIVNTNMVGAMRAVSVMRGVDPREYTVIVGGGAGGTHAAKIAEELGMRKVICPQVAGGLCAYGMLVADVRHTHLTTHPTSTATLDIDRVNEILAGMERDAAAQLAAQGFTPEQITLTRFADAKYPYQINELMIPLPSGEITAEAVELIATTFHDDHERLYTYCVREMPVDVNAWRVTATGRLPDLPASTKAAGGSGGGEAVKETRDVYFPELGHRVETPVYDGEALAAGTRIEGPAIAELPTTTLVVAPDHALSVSETGSFTIDISQTVGAGSPAGRGEEAVTQV
ncbi:hydantoinase/oxoprolinase family protein [Capillimicrobium parvum]|uniref:hydantoinase/oxoprolinase family protein n=1 Tax=Capillimicrobium parvum TaxID=2884022 RepID=UPI00216B1856|nr:hydantoinase/oxoprolinase family protein [Capillimicrobium parvum]